ncbi:mitochondrial 54S ribosomal protein [Starmerella bacillaris]|uniref:Large ribosomal subunit protein mL49 n=1 Tax=Starmerella bacillaris TaxID=1247836 RepID=A0AAV5RR15_STABA|nr:mitochondrial 54S ribosomal protein [Starmerella bacillaris]
MRIQRIKSSLKFQSQLKQVPVPRTARTTAEIGKYVEHDHSEALTETKTPLDKEYLAKMFPPLTESINPLLTPTPGKWYNLRPSRNGKLPIYTDYNNAGHCWTEVRRIEGDIALFRSDLQDALNLTNKEVFVKQASPTVVLKGNRVAELRTLLQSFTNQQ